MYYFLASVKECATILQARKGFPVFVKMTSPAKFLRETYDELKLVKWPKRSEVLNLTGVVILISIVVGIYIGGIDYIFTKITELIIK